MTKLLFALFTLFAALPAQAQVNWRPPQNAVLHIHFTDLPSTASELIEVAGNADLIEIDAFNASAEFISELHQYGKRVLCYINFGSWENWRPDSGQFPTQLIGAKYKGWAGEYWLDIRSPQYLLAVFSNRISMAKNKGCDGIDPDNLNGYQNATGFPLTRADQIAFNIWIAKLVHQSGLPIGLKNGEEMVDELIDAFDWATLESCHPGQWCDKFTPFISAGKAVFDLEYDNDDFWLDTLCPAVAPLGISAMMTSLALDGWKESCNLPLSEIETLFDWLETQYPTLLPRYGSTTASANGFTFRCYAKTRNCIGVRGDTVYLAERGKPELATLGNVKTLRPAGQ